MTDGKGKPAGDRQYRDAVRQVPGRVLIDLPEEYLLWFARKGEFPKGKLGMLMEMTLAIKIEGLDHLVKPLKKS